MSDEELKGGHPPALKVGGMRVSQHKPKSEKAEAPKPQGDSGDESKSSQTVMVSGAKASEADAFPKQAVKAFHEKPVPTHDKGASNKPTVIQQPKK